jgi:hypothetical protein
MLWGAVAFVVCGTVLIVLFELAHAYVTSRRPRPWKLRRNKIVAK